MRFEKGDFHAAEQLLPLVYDELRNLAAGGRTTASHRLRSPRGVAGTALWFRPGEPLLLEPDLQCAEADFDPGDALACTYRGERKIGKEPEAQVRRREASAACQILGANAHFFDFAHEKLVADAETIDAVAAGLNKVNPDIVVTHWPLDTHPNHHVTSSLVWQCYLRDSHW